MKTKFTTTGLLCFFLAASVSCKRSANQAPVIKDTAPVNTSPTVVSFPTPSYDPSSIDTTKLFTDTPVTHNLARTDLLEISGVAASRVNTGILYIHNDSGNTNQVFLTDKNGADKGTLTLEGVANRDWEDIAVGPGPVAEKSYVYVADIGDNQAKYQSVFVYRFVEPDLSQLATPVNLTITAIDKIELQYPDGPRNAETLMIDPATRDIYIASKESSISKIYVARYPQNITSAGLMTPLVQLNFNKATSGDISTDGSEILLRSNEVIWYWKLSAGTRIDAALATKPQHAPYANNEPQGEGICFAADGSGYFTNTEVRDYPGKLATISFYRKK